ncbi:ubiquitin-protein ligase E3 [Collybia nuda]|uniref:GID complex catalytic subunit 2 n=1 Tax=Collybia nuda TaxID=64659 RepID=A0A9P5Y6W0_9AGAR|nr:ubiquitin-protein ligase E3 [Collybia nuda]
MEGPLKELTKLERLTVSSEKALSIADSLASLLNLLQDAKQQYQDRDLDEGLLTLLSRTIEIKKEVDDRQKEVYSSIARLGKALDKKFPGSLPTYSRLFESPNSLTALERTIALHFLRTGQFETAQTFLEESGVDISEQLRSQFIGLHQILTALRNRDITPALEWASTNREFLHSRSSPLEFHLHRSQYIRLLLASHPPDTLSALSYAKTSLSPFYKDHTTEFRRLLGCIVYLPLSRLQDSPYSDLASPSLHFDLEPLFAKEYCASLGMSRQVPLRVVGDIGGGGALARIEKGRKVMRERKSEWSQTDELPIEIPLPAENRYHSIFACPVSKEQATETNPPMMMTCGHVITKDSLHKLSKPGGRVKCPYCPAESQLGSALRVYF